MEKTKPRLLFLTESQHADLVPAQLFLLQQRQVPSIHLQWDGRGLSELSSWLKVLEENPGANTLLASFHAGVAALHLLNKVSSHFQKVILLHPSLHLNVTGRAAPEMSFVPTTILCSSKISQPSPDTISNFASNFFYDFTLLLSAEEPTFESSLSLLDL